MSESFSAKSYHIHLNLFLQYPYSWNLWSKIRWWIPGVVLTSRGRTTRGPGSRCLHLWLRSSTSSSGCRWWPPWTTMFRHSNRLTHSLRLLLRSSQDSQVFRALEHLSLQLLTFTNAPDLYPASARFVVAFPLEYSPKVYQSVDRQWTY